MAVPTLWLQPSQWCGFLDHYTREKDEAVVGIRAFNCAILTCALTQSTIYGTWQGTSPHFTDTDMYSAPEDVLLQAMRALSLPTMLWDAWPLWPWGALLWLWRICLTSSVGQWTPYVLSTKTITSWGRHPYYSDFKDEDAETWRYYAIFPGYHEQ